MKTNFSLVLIFALSIMLVKAQINFSEAILISNQNSQPTCAYPADVDNDGDIDIISTSGGDHKIGWFENIDGLGTFGEQILITSSYDLPSCIKFADMDNDSYPDIVASFYGADNIIWFRNLNGSGDFEMQQIIDSDRDGAIDVSIADIDNDGDNDILAASWEDDTFIWYENSDSQGNFVVGQIIDTAAEKACRILPCDIDSDGDLDAIAATNYIENKIYWFENTDGSGDFQEVQNITTDLDNILSICLANINNDQYPDLLSASSDDNKVAWYESTNLSFGSQQIISTTSEDAFHVSSADLDNDGDEDVIVSCGVANRIEVFENLGNSTFSDAQLISITAPFVHSTLPSDIDGDGDLDLISAFWNSDQIVWYRNELQTSIENKYISDKTNLSNYPNPFSTRTTVLFTLNQASYVTINVFDLHGNKVLSLLNNTFYNAGNNSIDIDAHTLKSGIYYYQIETNNWISQNGKMCVIK